jgi:hypothetical protein
MPFTLTMQSNSELAFIFVSLPFEFFQKRGPHKVGDANKFMPRCALNFEEHGVRYAGLDRRAVGSRKYFAPLALSREGGLRFSGHSPAVVPLHAFDRANGWSSKPPELRRTWQTISLVTCSLQTLGQHFRKLLVVFDQEQSHCPPRWRSRHNRYTRSSCAANKITGCYHISFVMRLVTGRAVVRSITQAASSSDFGHPRNAFA